jgi:hypothetical protein
VAAPLAAGLLLVAATITLEPGPESPVRASQAERAEMVRALQLTDLVLVTEARYTRHLSQADRHSAFQDHPLALEHFPSGSLLGPPPALRRGEGLP